MALTKLEIEKRILRLRQLVNTGWISAEDAQHQIARLKARLSLNAKWGL